MSGNGGRHCRTEAITAPTEGQSTRRQVAGLLEDVGEFPEPIPSGRVAGVSRTDPLRCQVSFVRHTGTSTSRLLVCPMHGRLIVGLSESPIVVPGLGWRRFRIDFDSRIWSR